mmetsp:Transcript_25286/g.24680  ORF Transcript_25286/g.24680 Transcript_25286/m.24680 type:complete len:86 (-) Transcript_25286:216-473(-)
MEESMADTGDKDSDANKEFVPGVMYIEQLLRILPKEYSVKLKMHPAYEETLLKIYEERESKRISKAKEKEEEEEEEEEEDEYYES